jgi:S-adenosylmethionine:tRNA ribosyltransferase-isomerase
MKLRDLDYNLPESLIAQRPLADREASRMLVLDRKAGKWEHRSFRDLPEYIQSGDYFVFNQSKVIKARLLGQRDTGGKVEVFLLRQEAPGKYEALVKLTAAQKEGVHFSVGGEIRGKILKQIEAARFLVELQADNLELAIEKLGRTPLPPYIAREDDELDRNTYQTVYAKKPGSVAAPTAGLHFTEKMLSKLEGLGANLRWVTLHVGIGTFQPIKADDLADHKMHREFFELSDSLIEECKNAKRVVAVGTTTVRALESAARGFTDSTEIFLKPGEPFHFVDSMLTNFHQPKSSLIALMCAFVGDRDLLMSAYEDAIKEKYRFLSYGDCMLVL